MSKDNLRAYKGARDFYPEDQRIQDWMFEKWRRAVEGFGYQAYSAPVIEPTDLFLIKGNEEIVQEQTYSFVDRGSRKVTLRPEMTPSVSRMVAAKRQELNYPLRWYSIPNCWRYERTQRGRLREFWQLNVDIFGVEDVSAELEMLQVVDRIFQSFRAERSSYTIKVNSRQMVGFLLDFVGLEDQQKLAVVRLIDRFDKLDADDFAKKLDEITKDSKKSENIVLILKVKELDQLPETVREHPSAQKLEQLISDCKELGIDNVEFDIKLMRGFDYYTDIVFEVFDNHPENNRAMFGGGRYDGLVGELGAEPVPTVGFGMGDVTFQNFLEANELIPEQKSHLDALVLTVDPVANKQAMLAANELREMGAKVAVDYSGRKLEKQMRSADKSKAPFVVFVGPEDEGQFTLKNLKTGEETRQSLQRIASVICRK